MLSRRAPFVVSKRECDAAVRDLFVVSAHKSPFVAECAREYLCVYIADGIIPLSLALIAILEIRTQQMRIE